MAEKPDTNTALSTIYEPIGGTRAVFTGKSADYAASRPGYPPGLFEMLRSVSPPENEAVVADVGAGTGLLTAGLLEAGYRVVAVEPNAEMRAAADRQIGGVKGYRSVEGSAESLPIGVGSVSLITAAQAFHWFDVDRARAEFHRVLTSAGQVALIWNDRVLDDPIQMALDEVFLAYGGAKRTAVVARDQRSGVPRFFEPNPMRHYTFPNAQQLSREGLLGLVFSRSYIPARTSMEGAAVAERVGEIFYRHATEGSVEIRYQTTATLGRLG